MVVSWWLFLGLLSYLSVFSLYPFVYVMDFLSTVWERESLTWQGKVELYNSKGNHFPLFFLLFGEVNVEVWASTAESAFFFWFSCMPDCQVTKCGSFFLGRIRKSWKLSVLGCLGIQQVPCFSCEKIDSDPVTTAADSRDLLQFLARS